MKQTLTISVDASAAETVAKQIEIIVHAHEPELAVSEYIAVTTPNEKARVVRDDENDSKKMTFRLIAGAVIFVIGIILGEFVKVSLPVQLAFLVTAYMILGGDVVMRAVKNIVKGRVFVENFLMSLSTIGAFIIGEHPEAVDKKNEGATLEENAAYMESLVPQHCIWFTVDDLEYLNR